jgi:hypothetical protein
VLSTASATTFLRFLPADSPIFTLSFLFLLDFCPEGGGNGDKEGDPVPKEVSSLASEPPADSLLVFSLAGTEIELASGRSGDARISEATVAAL